MLKIGDFSRFARVSVKALRYYDELGITQTGESRRIHGLPILFRHAMTQLHRNQCHERHGVVSGGDSASAQRRCPHHYILDLLHIKQEEQKTETGG